MKIFFVNVGVNSSDARKRGIMSPIFEDGRFEFIPIKEVRKYAHKGRPFLRYKDLKCFNSDDPLTKYIPAKYHGYTVHNDPEFGTLTYGDLCNKNQRSSNLKKAEKGDYIFFLARLTPFKNGVFQKREAKFFLIGFLHIEKIIILNNKSPVSNKKTELIKNNAHTKRFLSGDKEIAWVFKGTKESIRFKYAVPFDIEFLRKTDLTYSDGSMIRCNSKNENTIIGSAFRTCRAVLDSNKPRDKEKIKKLFREINIRFRVKIDDEIKIVRRR